MSVSPVLNRGDAVNLARNIVGHEDEYRYLQITALHALAKAVLEMDEYIKQLDPYGRGVVKVGGEGF